MADSFADKYYPPWYFPPGYFQGGEQDPGAMSASLSGAGAVSASVSVADAVASRRHGVSPEFAKQADENKRAFEESQRERELALRASIERAFAGEQTAEPIAEPQRKVMARSVQAEIRLDGYFASLDEIARLLKAYEQALYIERERQLEEEAIIMLLLAA